MKVIVAGHEYELTNLDSKRIVGALYFVHKEVRNGRLTLVKDGTTTEEVLKVLIDRIEHLNTKVPCKENKEAIRALKKAFDVIEKRTADRQGRGVEGTHKE